MQDWFEKKDEFGIGNKSWATLRAIRNKLVVQYRPFIARLHLRFSKGPMGDVLDELDELVHSVLNVLHEVLDSGRASKDDQREILNSIGRIEHLLNILSKQEKQDTSFAQGLQEEEQGLGITLRDLTITRGFAAKGLRNARQTAGGRAIGRAQGVAKQGYSDILSAVSSVAGPFAPAANLALRGTSKVLGAGAQALFGERKSRRGPRGSYRSDLSGNQNVGESQDFVQAMRTFYDTDAYKARWTRELLDTLKGVISPTGAEKKGILGTIGDTLKEIGILGLAVKGAGALFKLLPQSVQDVITKFGSFLPTLAKISGLLLASYWTIEQWKKLWDVMVDRETANASGRKASADLKTSQSNVMNKLGSMSQADRNRTLKGMGYASVFQYAKATAIQQKAQETFDKYNVPGYAKDWGILNPVLGAFVGGVDKPQNVSIQDRTAQNMKISTTHPYQRGDMPGRYQKQYPEDWKRVTDKLDEINKTLKTGQQKNTVPFSGTGGPRNTYDSSDTFTDQFLRGIVSLGER